MQQAHLEINGVRTKVVTWGRWVEESPEGDNGPEDIIIVITGNPGLTRFYNVFLQTLHEQTGFAVWAIGHAGHEPPVGATERDVPALKGNEELYGMKGQIQHKVEFFEKYVPKTARVHLIGHSVGAYTVLQLLKKPEIKKQVVRNYLMFPTIEYIADTPNGKFLTGVVRYFVTILIFLSWIFMFLPSILQTFLVYVYMKIEGIPKMHLKTIIYFINPKILEKVFAMAFDEMKVVKERDDDIIRANLRTIKIYYSAKDGWAPVSYYERLKNDIPEANVELCQRGFYHTFVFNSSREVGSMIAGWINNRENN